MSKRLSRLVDTFARTVTAPLSRNRRRLTLALASERLRQIVTVQTERGFLRFECPTARALHDPLGFHSGEPETLGWIRTHVRPGDVVWDIGANVGIYALFTAQVPDVRVVAFEPSASTFAAFVRNIELNGMGERVTALCIALGDNTGIDFLHMANTAAGHSMHALGQLKTVNGDLVPAFSQAVPAFTIDDACALLSLPRPDHIKLDVDSIEEKILRGGRDALAGARSIAMEVAGESGAAAAEYLRHAGFEAAPVHGPARNRIFLNRALVTAQLEP